MHTDDQGEPGFHEAPDTGELAPPGTVRLEPAFPPPAAPGDPHRDSRGWTIGAAAVLALVLVRAAASAFASGDSPAYAFGTVVGAVLVPALAGLLIAKFVSRRAGLIATVAVGALVLVGSVAADAREQETNEQIDAALDDLGIDERDDVELTSDEQDCVDERGVENDDVLAALTDTGPTGADLQLDLIDVVAACTPRLMLTDRNVEQFRLGLSSGLSSDISTGESRCVVAGLMDAPKPSELISNDPVAYAELIRECLDEESLAAFRGEDGAGPQVRGDDPRLDDLADLCEQGAEPACDLLYNAAPAGSEYSEIAHECAGRGLTRDGLCTPGFSDNDADGVLDADSPAWQDTIEACRSGDMLACDFVFAFSEIGSVEERVGETCGERRAVAPTDSCRAQLGELAD